MDEDEKIEGTAADEALVEESASSIAPDVDDKAEKSEPAPDETAETPEKPGPEPAAELGDKGREELIATRKRAQEAEAQREEKAREAAHWRAVAEGKITPDGTPILLTEPELEDFEDIEGYKAAYRAYAVQEAMLSLNARKETDEANRTAAEAYRAYSQRLKEAAKDDPEILSIVARNDLPVSPTMAALIRDSDQSPKLVRYFNDHEDEARRLFDMAKPVLDARGNVVGVRGNPLAVAREIGKIETMLATAPVVKRVSTAPVPHEAVSGRGATVIDDDETNLSVAERIKRAESRSYI